MTFYLALAGAVLGALSVLLHAVGHWSAKAETLAEDVDKVIPLVPKP